MVADDLAVDATSLAPISYRSTDIGVVPNDWKVVSLRELVDPNRSIRYGIVQPGKYDAQGRYMIRGQDYSSGWVDPARMFRVSARIEERYKNARVKQGDILITIVGASTGKVSTVPRWLDGANLTQTTARLAISPEKASSAFCAFVLDSWYGEQQVVNYMKGGAQPGLNCGDIEKFLIPLPPTSQEQEAISEALSDADTHINLLEQQVEKKRLIRQGVMQELLSSRRRLPGFSGDWEKRSFGDVFSFLPTATNSRADLSPDGDAYYVHYGDIHTRFHSHLDFAHQKPPQIAREKCPRAALLRNGDWIMADASEDAAGVGKAVEVRGLSDNESAISGLHTFILREKTPVFVPGFKGHLSDAEFL